MYSFHSKHICYMCRGRSQIGGLEPWVNWVVNNTWLCSEHCSWSLVFHARTEPWFTVGKKKIHSMTARKGFWMSVLVAGCGRWLFMRACSKKHQSCSLTRAPIWRENTFWLAHTWYFPSSYLLMHVSSNCRERHDHRGKSRNSCSPPGIWSDQQNRVPLPLTGLRVDGRRSLPHNVIVQMKMEKEGARAEMMSVVSACIGICSQIYFHLNLHRHI